ncbi:MAG: right-handed parallel beta-helix repeat-containing protein [Thermoplasmata archaeon]|nr:MAG: right-handed parallel beta-helix repeat-containing protein [Thermoplasmata archaeon]
MLIVPDQNLIQTSSGTTIYVPTDYPTIQDAINASKDGDTVFVFNGTYYENVVVNKTINLTGENREITIIDGNYYDNTVCITANWVNITGFTISKSGSNFIDGGIAVWNTQNCSISNNEIIGNYNGIFLSGSNNIISDNVIWNNNNGIRFNGATFNNISNNLFSSNGGHDIYFEGASNNNISDNNFFYSNFAFFFVGGSGNTIISNYINEVNQIWFRETHYNNFINNNVSCPKGCNFQLYKSSNFNIIGNNISNNLYGISLTSSSNNNISNNNFINSGIHINGGQLSHFNTHTIPDNNLVNGKPLYYYKDVSGINIDGIEVGQLILVNCSDFNVKNLQINNTSVGILVAYSHNNFITSNKISNNHWGMLIYFSSNNITLNTVVSNYWGFYIYDFPDNKIYHNNIINNYYPAFDYTYNGVQWDNGYPSGGNYWSDYSGVDENHGPGQNISGSDGIGDSSYIYFWGETEVEDRYPLMYPYGNCSLMYEGWNLISLPLIQQNTDLSSVLSTISGSYSAIQWYNSSDKKDQWKHNCTSKSPHLNDLDNLNHTMGFWIYITEPGGVLFRYLGTQPTENQSITLYQGWNMVGYPSLSIKNRTTALNNLNFTEDVDAIWTYNSRVQRWEKMGPSDYFEVGRGYYIHAKSKCDWEVPL